MPQNNRIMASVDLRAAITQRLVGLSAERRRLEARLAVVTEIEKELRGLMQTQTNLGLDGSASPASLSPRDTYDNGKVKEFLLRQLRAEAQTTDELTEKALQSGFNFGDRSPARIIHFNLLNLKNAGMVELSGDVWKFNPEKQTA
jgi:hypothetical protein